MPVEFALCILYQIKMKSLSVRVLPEKRQNQGYTYTYIYIYNLFHSYIWIFVYIRICKEIYFKELSYEIVGFGWSEFKIYRENLQAGTLR